MGLAMNVKAFWKDENIVLDMDAESSNDNVQFTFFGAETGAFQLFTVDPLPDVQKHCHTLWVSDTQRSISTEFSF